MKTAALRSAFVDYFARRGHQHLPSGPLVPRNDPSLLFANAGMVQVRAGEIQPTLDAVLSVMRKL